MTETTTSCPTRNGVDVPTQLATVDMAPADPQFADYQLRGRSTWVSGTANRTTIEGFYGAMQQDTGRIESFVYDADHSAVLVETNQAPTPVEFLLHAIAACIAAGLANIAATAQRITLHRVGSTVEGDIDLLGILDLDSDLCTGWRQMRVSFTVDGDATPEQLGALIHTLREMGPDRGRIQIRPTPYAREQTADCSSSKLTITADAFRHL